MDKEREIPYLSDEELMGVAGGSGIDVPKKEHISRYDSAFHAL